MTDFGSRAGDMLKSVYDDDDDGVISLLHTRANMEKATYDPLDHGVVADSQRLENKTLAQVQDHTPKTHPHTESEIIDLDHDADKIKGVAVDDTDKADGKALEYNSTSGNLEYETPPAGGPADAIRADGTPGRVFRGLYITIQNGTDNNTLKCTVGSRFNGDVIATTDNIVLNNTTGHFTLDSQGYLLTIEAAGLSGNVLHAAGHLSHNSTLNDMRCSAQAFNNDVRIKCINRLNASPINLTTSADLGDLTIDVQYLTDA